MYAGGGPPGGVDFLDLTYGAFPWLVLVVLLVTYFLLVRAFRSLLLPLKAIVLNLLSIGAAYGLLVAVFKWGWGDWAGVIAYDQIEGWIPVMLFAMLFGLSMDYEVFLVSRMREEWDATGDNAQSVITGLARTGRIVTAAGLVMFAAFMGFVAGSIVGLQQFGFGLAAAIVIDVTIIRALLVPVGDGALRPLELVVAAAHRACRAGPAVAAGRAAAPGAAPCRPLAQRRVDDDGDEDDEDERGEAHGAARALLAGTGAGLRHVRVARRRGLAQDVVLALEHLGLLLDEALLVVVGHGVLVPGRGVPANRAD